MADQKLTQLTEDTTPTTDDYTYTVTDPGGTPASRKTTLGNLVSIIWAAVTNSATEKTTPVDADLFSIVNTAASNALYKLTWANVKATLKTYFDTLYDPLHSTTSHISLLAFQGYPAATGGCSALTIVDSGSQDVNYRVLDFDPTTQEYAHWDVILPPDYDGGNITAEFIWLANDSTGNAVIWGIQGYTKGNDNNMNLAYPTGVEVTDQSSTTGVNRLMISAATAAIGVTGATAGFWTSIRVYRKAADAGDTLATDARLLAVRLIYTKA